MRGDSKVSSVENQFKADADKFRAEAEKFFDSLKITINKKEISLVSLITDGKHSQLKDGLIQLLGTKYCAADWKFLKESQQLFSGIKSPTLEDWKDHITKFVDPTSSTEMNLEGGDAKALLASRDKGTFNIDAFKSAIKTVFQTSIIRNTIQGYASDVGLNTKLAEANKEVVRARVQLTLCNTVDALADNKAAIKAIADSSGNDRASTLFKGALLQIEKFENDCKALLAKSETGNIEDLQKQFNTLQTEFIDNMVKNIQQLQKNSGSLTMLNALEVAVSAVKRSASPDLTNYEVFLDEGGKQGMKDKIAARVDSSATATAVMTSTEVTELDSVFRTRSISR